MKHPVQPRLRASLLLPGVALALVAGCGGGSSGLPANNNSNNSGLASVNFVASTVNNQLLRFNSRTPNTITTSALSGLASGQSLVGLDYRTTLGSATVPAPAGATMGLYGLAQSGTMLQLYRINLSGTSATATAVGSTFTLSPAPTSVGFDFNPAVDRIRVVDSQGRNLRLNPDTGAVVDGNTTMDGTQFDTPLAYDSTDSAAGQTPSVVGAAYTNNTQNTASTVNYAIDRARNVLVTQGRPANASVPGDVAVSPNTGRLFTVGSLGVTTTNSNLGFDIATTSGTNTGFVSLSTTGGSTRLFGINLSSGALTGGALVGNGQTATGLAIVP